MLPHTRAPRSPLPQAEQASDAGHDPLWWARIILTAADVALIARALGHPATKPQLATLWQAFLQEQAETKAALQCTDWSQVPDDDLVAYGEGRAAVLAGIGSFLPSGYGDVPFAVRCSLYVHLLVLFGIGAVAAGVPVSPLFLALEAARLHQGGQYAVREMSRRGSKHVGMHMALLLLAARGGAHAAVVAQALEALRKAMHKKIPPGTRDVIGRASHTGGKTDFHAAWQSERDLQSFETGHQRWGRHLDWRTLLTRGFGGGLDIAPRAIADDLTDSARKLSKLPIPVPFESVLHEELPAEARFMVEKLNEPAEDLARREAEVFADRLLLDQLKAAAGLSPLEAEVFEIVRALGDEHGAIKTAAERLGIKAGTARVTWFRAMKKLRAAAQRLEAADRT